MWVSLKLGAGFGCRQVGTMALLWCAEVQSEGHVMTDDSSLPASEVALLPQSLT